MMNRTATPRWAPLTGVLYGALFIVGFGMSGDAPAEDASGQKVIAFYSDHHSAIRVSSFVLVAAAISFIFFAGAVREALRRNDNGSEWLPTVAFGGGVAYAISLGLFAVAQSAVLKGADLGAPDLARTLNVLNSSMFFPAMLALSVFLLAAGAAAIQAHALPKWLAWITAVVGAVSVLGPLGFVAFFLMPLWGVVGGVILSRRGSPDAISTTVADQAFAHTA